MEKHLNVSFEIHSNELKLDPYPWAIEEGFDAYRTLMETKGSGIGIRSGKLEAVLSGDSA